MDPTPPNNGDIGVNGVGLLVTSILRWYFRPQYNADVGIDAQIEPWLAGRPSGRLLGVQIKSGPSQFSEPLADGGGWVYREDSQTHRDYWLNYRLPVILVLYNEIEHAAYWQHITSETAVITGKGFKVIVPSQQRVDDSAYNALVHLAREVPPDGLSELLDQLPPSCAEQLRAWDVLAPLPTRSLAATLVAGSRDAAQTVLKVIGNWEDQPSQAWLAVGQFAREHGLYERAAECFLSAHRAAEDGQGSPRLRVFAGLLLSATAPEEARSLLTECAQLPETRLLAAIGLAQLDHVGSSRPIPVPSVIADDPVGAAAEPTVQSFLAEQQARAGEWDSVVEHRRRALQTQPGSSQQVALADALLRRASQGSITSSEDFQEATERAEEARTELRRWRGDSTDAARILMQARMLRADTRAALSTALAVPDGEATVEEAASAHLAMMGARIAYGEGDTGLGDRFGAVVSRAGDPVQTSHLAAMRAAADGSDTETQERAWRRALAADDDPSSRLTVSSKLAELGCWPIPELDQLQTSGLLTNDVYEVMHARALNASGQFEEAVALLRRAQSNSLIATEALAMLLDSHGMIDECVQECDDASVRFGTAHLDLLALDVLTRAGRNDEVMARANDLLTRDDLAYGLRHQIRGRLISEARRQGDWRSCERLCQRGWDETSRLLREMNSGHRDPLTTPVSAMADLATLQHRYAWSIIGHQMRQGKAERAYATYNRLTPGIRNPSEAALWTDVQQDHGWTPETVETVLLLTDDPTMPPEQARWMLVLVANAVQAAGWDDFRDRISDKWTAINTTSTPY